MKKAVCLLAIMLITGQALAAEITFTIPDAKLSRVIAAMKGIYPIPDADQDGQPDFTDKQWAKEALRRWIIHTVARYEQATARQAVSYTPDDTIAE